MTDKNKTRDEYQKQYHNLIDSEQFDMLELRLKEPNIFRILKLSHYEIRHSNFLAWLLDPKASHSLGDTILKRFVRHVLNNAEPNNLMLHELNFSNVEIRREWKNIDLLIIFDNAVITIENKIHSGEHSNQLKRYRDEVEKEFGKEKKIKKENKIYVFLTPNGIGASDESYVNISYQIFIDILERVLKFYDDNMADAIKHYINDYLITLKEDVMGDGESAKLANELYRANKEILDFIYEYKTDIFSEFQKVFKEIIKKDEYKFLKATKNYLPFIPENFSETEPKFCYNVYLHPKNTEEIFLEFVIAPWNNDEQAKREKFKDMLNRKNLLGGKKLPENSNQWIYRSMHSEKINTDITSIYDDDGRKKIKQEFKDIWNGVFSDKLEKIKEEINEFFQENQIT